MACPSCGCKVHYQFNSEDNFAGDDERLERCAACGAVFDIEDAADDEDDAYGVMVAPAPQPDESKLPPRPAGSNDADTDPDSPLKRYGRASKESGLLLEPMADGYWTPWHIANELLRAATGKDGVAIPPGGQQCE
jgi:hypothetical protein